jgi:hypothetical protein
VGVLKCCNGAPFYGFKDLSPDVMMAVTLRETMVLAPKTPYFSPCLFPGWQVIFLSLWVLGCSNGGGKSGSDTEIEPAHTGLEDTAPTSPGRLAAGLCHTCWLDETGAPTCWGWDDEGQATPPNQRFRALAAGPLQTCGLGIENKPVCWGAAVDPPDVALVSISLGGYRVGCGAASTGTPDFACGLDADGAVHCWGEEDDGQVSDAPAGTFTQVSVGGAHACALATDGTVQCWGSNVYDQSIAPAGSWNLVSVGGWHSCVVGDGNEAHCWGSNQTNQGQPWPGRYSQLSSGAFHNCGVESNEWVMCWGVSYGASTPPDDVTGNTVELSAGGWHTCGLMKDDSVLCWGRDNAGQSSPPSPPARAD